MAVKYLSGNRVTAISTDLVAETNDDTAYTGTGTNNIDYIEYMLISDSSNAGKSISAIRVKIASSANSPEIKGAIYADNGSGTPSTLLATTPSDHSVTATGWQTIPITATVPSDGKVWVAFLAKTSSGYPSIYADTSGAVSDSFYCNTSACKTWATAFANPASTVNNGYRYSVGIVLESPKLGTTTTTVPQTSWKLLARGVYDASDPDTLDSGTFTAKDNLMVIGNKLPNGSSDLHWTINGQTTGYAWRFSNNGASDVAYGSRTYMLGDSGESTNLSFQVGTMSNTLNKEKQMICNSIEASTAGNTSPTRRESVNKSIYQPQITSIVGTNVGSGSFATGSEILVLGCDNDEADSGTNFWQELASVTLSSVGDDLDTGTFTAKKYLKIEFYSDGDGTGNAEVFPVIAFNNDTTQANYAVRRSNNFASDDTFDTSHGGYGLYLGWGGGNDPEQCTAYISNNSGYEKLYMGEMNIRGNVNAIGDYNQHCGKWKTTSGQITRINIRNGGGSQFSTNSYLKVWGAD